VEVDQKRLSKRGKDHDVNKLEVEKGGKSKEKGEKKIIKREGRKRACPSSGTSISGIRKKG